MGTSSVSLLNLNMPRWGIITKIKHVRIRKQTQTATCCPLVLARCKKRKIHEYYNQSAEAWIPPQLATKGICGAKSEWMLSTYNKYDQKENRGKRCCGMQSEREKILQWDEWPDWECAEWDGECAPASGREHPSRRIKIGDQNNMTKYMQRRKEKESGGGGGLLFGGFFLSSLSLCSYQSAR